jgi:hypothetical protein
MMLFNDWLDLLFVVVWVLVVGGLVGALVHAAVGGSDVQ